MPPAIGSAVGFWPRRTGEENPGAADDEERTAATEAFVQHATSAQEYAYTASFGEYNPSGGKDQVAKYMGYSKNELKLARDALKDILNQAGYKL